MVGRWFFMIIGTIFCITPAFVYWLAGSLAIEGDPTAPTVGDIVAFTTLQSRLFFPLGQLLNVQVEIQGALALFDRIFEYLEMDPEIVDAPDAVALDPTAVRGQRPLPRRVVPLPDRGRAIEPRASSRCRRPRTTAAESTEDAREAAADADGVAADDVAAATARRLDAGVAEADDRPTATAAIPALELLRTFALERHRLRGASPASWSRSSGRRAPARRRRPT